MSFPSCLFLQLNKRLPSFLFLQFDSLNLSPIAHFRANSGGHSDHFDEVFRDGDFWFYKWSLLERDRLPVW